MSKHVNIISSYQKAIFFNIFVIIALSAPEKLNNLDSVHTFTKLIFAYKVLVVKSTY